MVRTFEHSGWWKVTFVIVLSAVVNKSLVHVLPDIEFEKYSASWFAAKIPYACIRLLITWLTAYFFIGFRNIRGCRRFRWYFLIFIPIQYWLIRPGLVDYSELELSSAALAAAAMALGVTQEELFSRGIVYTHIKRKTNGFWAAALSSVIFGLLHHSFAGAGGFSIDELAGNVILPFILGLIFCTVYHFSGSLAAAVILHFIWNITSLFWSAGG